MPVEMQVEYEPKAEQAERTERTRVGQIGAELQSQSKNLEALDFAIGRLSESLAPIVSYKDSQPEPDAKIVDIQRVQVAEDIRQHNRIIESMIRRVNALTEGLEL